MTQHHYLHKVFLNNTSSKHPSS